jgi:hypothetical protein
MAGERGGGVFFGGRRYVTPIKDERMRMRIHGLEAKMVTEPNNGKTSTVKSNKKDIFDIRLWMTL